MPYRWTGDPEIEAACRGETPLGKRLEQTSNSPQKAEVWPRRTAPGRPSTAGTCWIYRGSSRRKPVPDFLKQTLLFLSSGPWRFHACDLLNHHDEQHATLIPPTQPAHLPAINVVAKLNRAEKP